jgi:glutathione S-transferase
MSLTLYYVPKTRSSRPRWILEEIGVPYELVRLEPADTKKAVYLAVHPLGKVPALVDDGVTLFESAALCLYLADKYGDGKLSPAPGTSERGLYYQWILFAMASIEPHLSRFNELRAASNGDAAEREREAKSARDHLGVVERALAGHEFIVGDRFTAADVVLASVCSWAKLLGLTEGLPECDAYARRLLARPAAKRARES